MQINFSTYTLPICFPASEPMTALIATHEFPFTYCCLPREACIKNVWNCWVQGENLNLDPSWYARKPLGISIIYFSEISSNYTRRPSVIHWSSPLFSLHMHYLQIIKQQWRQEKGALITSLHNYDCNIKWILIAAWPTYITSFPPPTHTSAPALFLRKCGRWKWAQEEERKLELTERWRGRKISFIVHNERVVYEVWERLWVFIEFPLLFFHPPQTSRV